MSKIIIGRSSSAFDEVVPSFDPCFELRAKIKMFSHASLPKKLKYLNIGTFSKTTLLKYLKLCLFPLLNIANLKSIEGDEQKERWGGSIHNKELLVGWPPWGNRPKRESGTLTAFLSISFELILLLKILDPPIQYIFSIKDGKQRNDEGKCLEKEYNN